MSGETPVGPQSLAALALTINTLANLMMLWPVLYQHVSYGCSLVITYIYFHEKVYYIGLNVRKRKEMSENIGLL